MPSGEELSTNGLKSYYEFILQNKHDILNNLPQNALITKGQKLNKNMTTIEIRFISMFLK
jgi:hypothetical protein